MVEKKINENCLWKNYCDEALQKQITLKIIKVIIMMEKLSYVLKQICEITLMSWALFFHYLIIIVCKLKHNICNNVI